MMPLPLPSQRFHSAVVIASQWMSDETQEDGTPPFAVVLLLTDVPGRHYRVEEIALHADGWHATFEKTLPNIIPAVEAFQEIGAEW